MLNTRHMQYKIDVKCRDLHNFELFDIKLKLNDLFNICVLNDLYVFYTYTKCRYCINMCVIYILCFCCCS